MISRQVWIAVSIAAFLAGIVVAYGIFTNTYQSMHMSNQQVLSQMMNERMAMAEFQGQMIQHMRDDHGFTQDMITDMMHDPTIRGQMIGHMVEDQEFMQQMQQAMGNQTRSDMGMME